MIQIFLFALVAAICATLVYAGYRSGKKPFFWTSAMVGAFILFYTIYIGLSPHRGTKDINIDKVSLQVEEIITTGNGHRLSGTVENQSMLPLAEIGILVTRTCADEQCQATSTLIPLYLHVPSGKTYPFDLAVLIPALEDPKATLWTFDIHHVKAYK